MAAPRYRTSSHGLAQCLLVSAAFIISVVPFPDSDAISPGEYTIQRPALRLLVVKACPASRQAQHIVTVIGLFQQRSSTMRGARRLVNAGIESASRYRRRLRHAHRQMLVHRPDQCHWHGLSHINASETVPKNRGSPACVQSSAAPSACLFRPQCWTDRC